MNSSNTHLESDLGADGAAAGSSSDTMTIDWSPENIQPDNIQPDSMQSDSAASTGASPRFTPSALGASIAGGTRRALGYLRRSPRKPVMLSAAIVVALAAALAGTATAMAKTVTITVDGVSQNVTTLSGTVNGALASAGLKVGAHDSLAPSGRSDISDGSQISLSRGRTFTAVVDGTERTVWTTASTVSDALDEIGEHASDLQLSLPASAAIPLDGLSVTAATLHDVTLTVRPATVHATKAAVRAATSATSAAQPPAPKMAATSDASTMSATQADLVEPVEYTTAAQTVGAFLDEQGLTLAPNQEVTPDVDTKLTDHSAIEVVTLPTVALAIGSDKAATVYSDASTVADLLAKQGVSLGSYDEVTPAVDTPVTDGLKVKVTKVSYKTTTKTVSVAQPADQQKADPSLKAGTKKVVSQGHPGEVTVYYHTKIANGVAGDPVEVSRKTVTAAAPSVVHVGTKDTSPSSSSAKSAAGPTSTSANGVNWDAVAQCESGQRWNINTGNGYYGGLQFDIRTWLGNGGGKYAPRADLATKAQQIDIANYVYAHRGLQPWGCGWAG